LSRGAAITDVQHLLGHASVKTTEKAYVTETIGQATQLSAGTHDLGPEDGENVVLIEI